MKQRAYQRDIRAVPLLEEFRAAGVPALAVRPPVEAGGPTLVDLDDAADEAAADAVVAAHDPAAHDQAQADAHRSYDDAVAYLKQFRQQASGTATNAQRDNAIKALIDVSKVQHQALREQG